MPRVFISKYLPTMYNVESFKAVSSYPTVLDMLKIKDPVVANCLIDMIQIESIILIDDFDAAIELMMNAPPKYCHSAFLKNGDQIFPEFYRYYSCPKKLCIGLLSPFYEQDIRETESELENINEEIGNKAKRIRELTEQLKKCAAERKSLDEASINLEIMVVELNEELEANRKIEKPRDISDLKSDLNRLNEEKKKMEDKIKNCEVQLSNQEAALQIINSKMDEERDLVSKKQKENHSLNSEIQECRKKLNCLQTSISRHEKSLKTFEGKAKDHKEALSKAIQAAEVAVRNAEKFSPPINTERSSSAIKKVLNETKKVLEQVSNCEMENLKRRYEEKTAKLEHAKSDLEHIESYIIKINEMMEKRSKKFANILKNTKLCLSMNFITYLNSSGFVGDLIFDDNQETLIIEAAPRDSESDKHAQTLYALSGGERSFISICFLLSLWEGLEMPFRILDEFDIFMDSQNRHLSFTHLTEVAKQKTDVQFIFLSPLEIPIMKDSAYIRVHKMPAPKRTEADEETM
ncbi:structural maintenance of chromosomes protein 6-like [Stegodyphus dumicola]|uniref:structural maintenance of chromosomes protein 6-like n=1 Tax=Stegodyphus dumicola TaxID=202533 RepID=UPI0015A8030D|nr:structural maintenance of chromosomes protein 6-like [Stegodyphus dumicola]